MRAVLLVPCLFATLALSAARQTPEDVAALAGVWEGTEVIEPTGGCQMDMPLRGRVKVRVSVDGDGRLHAQRVESTSGVRLGSGESGGPVVLPPVARSDEPEWTGRRIGDRVEFELPQTGHCHGTLNPNNYTMKLEGPLSITKKGERQMRMTGDDRPCPSMGCTFRRTFALTWKRALP
jgi:hypothetical protein